MPHAQILNLVTCADPTGCVQPGTHEIPMSVGVGGDVLVLEFCDKHADRAADASEIPALTA